tara:strand:- start:74 stop:976 length:903 start_codon:yes stop_codon:yes gene_type:complete
MGNDTVSTLSLRSKLLGFIALMKLRVIELLLITTVPTMIVAEEGIPSVWLIIATLFGGTLAAGGANAINMYIDRDIDKLMERTKNRPLVTGVLTSTEALSFAIAIEAIAFVWLWIFVNLLSAVLAASACLFYVFVYSLWLKRSSTSNIVIGGAAGAVPVLIGWSSVTNSIDWPPIILFLVIFLWTPPHFWALAIRYKDDYSNAEVPMLPVIEGTKVTGYRMVLYAFQVWAASLIFVPVADMGVVYLITAIAMGAIFTLFSFQVMTNPTKKSAMRLFGFSISYITILFSLMAVDQLVRSGF